MIVLGIILAILILILLIPVGVYARYNGDTTVKACPSPLSESVSAMR